MQRRQVGEIQRERDCEAGSIRESKCGGCSVGATKSASIRLYSAKKEHASG